MQSDDLIEENKRLQAEVADVSKSYEALAHVYAATQKGFEKMMAERDTLQAELTKARELLGERDALLSDFCAHSALICGDLLRLTREDDCAITDPIRTRAYSAMDHSRKVKKIQSAPADKGDCAHSEANRHGCPECGEEFKS